MVLSNKSICISGFTGDMHLMMPDGSFRKFRELEGEEVAIRKVQQIGIRNIVRIRLSNRMVIKTVPDQEFLTIDGIIKAKNLKNKRIRPNGCSSSTASKVLSVMDDGEEVVFGFDEYHNRGYVVEWYIVYM